MTADLRNSHKIVKDIIDEVSRVVIGKSDIKEILLIALLSQGHVLIEGLPGTAKTTIARTFATAIGGSFKRVQGTPDMLPADILGFYLYRPDGNATFMPGPIFANVVLADELNRTTPRTQSALLESMQEQQVTIERETHHLEQPFILIASQIPHGGVGTSPLSEVQADRFMFRIWSALPSMEEEDRMLKDIDVISAPQLATVTTPVEIIRLQQEVKEVHIADNVRRYIINIVDSLRHHPDILHGPGPRASIALFKGARALAFIRGRDFVLPDDIKQLAVLTISHRLRLTSEAEMENITPESIIKKVIQEIAVPKEGIASTTDKPDRIIPPQSMQADAAKHENTQSGATPPIIASADIPANGQASPAAIPVKTREIVTQAAPNKKRFDIKTLSKWQWALIILALVIAGVMISVGLSLR